VTSILETVENFYADVVQHINLNESGSAGLVTVSAGACF
jgi:hypothetical protein